MAWIEAIGRAAAEGFSAVLLLLLAPLPDAYAEPLEYAFMQRALVTALVVGVVCGVLSCFVILKRWALFGDAISHAVLPGVAIAYLIGWPFFVGAFITGAVTSVGIGLLERHTRLKADAAMGLMFTAAFALGVVIIGQIATATHLMHILFGNVLGVGYDALGLTLLAALLALGGVALFYKELFLYTFDETQARAIGLPVGAIHYGLILLLTLTIVASLETVGIILVVAMLITPGATAYLLTDRLSRMVGLAALFGAIAAIGGLYASYFWNMASGGAIVLVATALFAAALLAGPRHGLIARRRRRRTGLAQ